MQLFDKPNKYTLFYYLFSSNFAHTTTFEPVLLFRLPSLLPKVKTDGSQAERKQKVRFDSVSLPEAEAFVRSTPFSLHLPLSDGPTVVPIPGFYIFPLFLLYTIFPQNIILLSNRSNKEKGLKTLYPSKPLFKLRPIFQIKNFTFVVKSFLKKKECEHFCTSILFFTWFIRKNQIIFHFRQKEYIRPMPDDEEQVSKRDIYYRLDCISQIYHIAISK